MAEPLAVATTRSSRAAAPWSNSPSRRCCTPSAPVSSRRRRPRAAPSATAGDRENGLSATEPGLPHPPPTGGPRQTPLQRSVNVAQICASTDSTLDQPTESAYCSALTPAPAFKIPTTRPSSVLLCHLICVQASRKQDFGPSKPLSGVGLRLTRRPPVRLPCNSCGSHPKRPSLHTDRRNLWNSTRVRPR